MTNHPHATVAERLEALDECLEGYMMTAREALMKMGRWPEPEAV